MSTNITSLKLKVLGFGAAAVIGASLLLGATNSAKAATFTCPDAARGGQCHNVNGRGEALTPGGQIGKITSGKNLPTKIEGRNYYLHSGQYDMAWYPKDLQETFFENLSPTDWNNLRVNKTKITAVPIPAALPLFGAALLGLGILSRRRKNKKTQA